MIWRVQIFFSAIDLSTNIDMVFVIPKIVSLSSLSLSISFSRCVCFFIQKTFFLPRTGS